MNMCIASHISSVRTWKFYAPSEFQGHSTRSRALQRRVLHVELAVRADLPCHNSLRGSLHTRRTGTFSAAEEVACSAVQEASLGFRSFRNVPSPLSVSGVA